MGYRDKCMLSKINIVKRLLELFIFNSSFVKKTNNVYTQNFDIDMKVEIFLCCSVIYESLNGFLIGTLS